MRSEVAIHKRTGRSRKLLLAAMAVVTVVALAGGAAYAWRGKSGCNGPPVTVTVAAAPDQAAVMTAMADAWRGTRPAVNGKCVAARVTSKESGAVAAALGPGWNEGIDGARPDAWAPESRLWLLAAANRPDANAVIPLAESPSIASSAIVLAVRRPMAEALGWPGRTVDWWELLGAFAEGRTWAQFGHPEWGGLRFGLADPTGSTASMHALLTLLDRDNDGKLSDAEFAGSVGFAQMVTDQATDTKSLMDKAAAAEIPAAPVFPVIERDLVARGATDPAHDFVPVYSSGGPAYADYPFATLTAPWVDDVKRQAAGAFAGYLRGAAGQRAYAEAGFRGPDQAAAQPAALPGDRGFRPDHRSPPRAPAAAAVTEVLGKWAALERPVNLLIVLDVSGSMNDPVPGTGATRLQLLQQAAIRGIMLLNNQTSVGLWAFSTKLTPTTDYQELVPLGLAGENIGPVPRRQAMVAAVQGLTAHGGTGLYDTVHDAYLKVQASWRPEAENFVMVITDGRNEFDDGMTRPELVAKLQQANRPDKPTPVLAIAVGTEADSDALQEISQITGGRTFIGRDVNAGRLPR